MPAMIKPHIWALSPEFAEQIAELYQTALSPASEVLPKVEDPTPSDVAHSITSQVGNIAVIRIAGPLDRRSRISWFSGKLYAIGQDAIRIAVEDALHNASVRAVLLSIDSPGGVVAGTKELADYIAEAATIKPMGAYVDGLAASAGYWLASATGRVLAPATGQVGSIGVIMMVADYSGYYQRVGVSFEYIASGKYKAAGRGERPLTEEERAYFQDKLSALHTLFRADVAARMQITAPSDQWAEAQVMLAQKAVSLGLVSSLVRDEAEAIKTMLEVSMPDYTREALAKEAPDLLASLKVEGREEALAEVKAKAEEQKKAGCQDGIACALSAMRAICKPEDVQAVEALLEKSQALGLSAEQLAGVAQLFPRAEQQTVQEDSRQSVLAALQAAHEKPLNVESPSLSPKSSLVADAERRAQAAV